LTYSVLYLSIYLHRANRTHQQTLLAQQTSLLTSLVEPASKRSKPGMQHIMVDADQSRRKQSISEMVKDRWNAEVEGMATTLQQTDWEEVRQRWERRGVNLWRNLTKD
jgi:Altered inheritance of mitochondria 5